MCNVRALLTWLQQSIFDTCSTKGRAARDVLLELPRHGTLLSRNGVGGGNNSGQRGKYIAAGRRSLFKNGTWKDSWTCRCKGCVGI